jgi:exonuclease SbcC
MKPLFLKMSAFGPYAGTQELDFSNLQNRTFFLIHGPTGSGKTTILDAMCFALYGDSSGGQRDSRGLRSDHAPVELLTVVEFVFAIGSQSYKVRRIPEQMRPKKRGEGMTAVPGEAALWCLSKAAGEQLLAGKWLEVTQTVESLLGFKCNQFRQVVLLPQGDFQKLLKAHSGERQEILQALFKTEQYQALEALLKEKAVQCKKQYEELSEKWRWVLQEAQAASPQQLQEEYEGHRRELTQAQQEMIRAQLNLAKAQAEVTRAVMIREKLAEQETARQVFTDLSGKVTEIEESRLIIANALRAEALAEAHRHLQLQERSLNQLKAALEGYKLKLKAAREEQGRAETLRSVEQAKAGEREAIARNLLILQQAERSVNALQEAKAVLNSAKAAAESAVTAKNEMDRELMQTQNQLKVKEEQEQVWRQSAAERTLFQTQRDEWKRKLTRRLDLQKWVAERNSLSLRVLDAARKSEALQKRQEEAKAALQLVQQQWIEGQAALLAGALQEGEACPVCGAIQHPRPAKRTGAVIGKKELQQAQAALDKLERQKEASKEEYHALLVSEGVLSGKVKDLSEELEDILGLPLAELENAVLLKNEMVEKAVLAEKQAQATLKEIELLKRSVASLQPQAEEKEIICKQAESRLQQAKAAVEARLAVVPEEYRESGRLSAARLECMAADKRLQEALQAAEQMYGQAQQQVVKFQTEVKRAQEQWETGNEALAENQRQFHIRILQMGFPDVAEYEAAQKPEEYIRKLEAQTKEFDGRFAAANERLQRAVAAAKGLITPDLDQVKAAAQALQEEYNSKLSICAKLEEKIQQAAGWLNKLQQFSALIQTAEERFGVIGRLSEVANGGNEYKLTFQRFVLGTLLDDVAMAANQRLKLMSRGRYELQRTMDRARKNAAGGLELEVFDHYTGFARSVNTLSGGETFLASLSLALGLVDVVQSYAGGIRLETLLVDEGFGTLDPEALDLAIRSLMDLQQDGRLVGIISHVPELKERIDARLEVMVTDRGSKASFKVG